MDKIQRISLFFIIILLIITYYLIGTPVKVSAAECTNTNVRWASSSNSIYVTGPVTCTLTQLKTINNALPLDLVDSTNKIWLLRANLRLEQGATLNLVGTGAGGDVNELRLKSNNSSDVTSTIFIRAFWGNINISNTKITSWNQSTNSPDMEYGTYKRSYIHAISFLDNDGVTARESRMDIQNSDIGYLGFYGAEAYGIVWKVRGTTTGIYDKVNVYGNVTNNKIHHNYFGAYTYGAEAMQWLSNEIYNNIQYGLDPHDDSDNLVIVGNNSHDNGNHGIICSQRCNNLTIRNNISHKNVGHGIMLHRNTNNSIVENNQTNDNTDTGIVIFDSHNNILSGNTSLRNKNGIRLSVGSSGNLIQNNNFGANTAYGFYTYKGSDVPTTGDGRPKLNRVINNRFADNKSYIMKLKEGDQNTFENNTFINNSREAYIDNSNNNIFVNNSFTGGSYNFYNPRNNSINTVQNTDFVRVKIGDSLSKMNIVDTRKYVYQNDRNLSTTVDTAKSQITFTRSLSTNIVNFTRINLIVSPSNNQIYITPQNWVTSGDYYKKWTETSNNSSITANHIVGNLQPGILYNVLVNGSLIGNYTANSLGNINFNYNGGYTGSKVFEITSGAISSISSPSVESDNSSSSATQSAEARKEIKGNGNSRNSQPAETIVTTENRTQQPANINNDPPEPPSQNELRKEDPDLLTPDDMGQLAPN